MFKSLLLVGALLAIVPALHAQDTDSSESIASKSVNSGWRFWIGGGGGEIFSGSQSETGVIWFGEAGDTVSSRVSQGGFHLQAGYCVAGRWVLDLGYAARFASVQPKSGATSDPISLFTKHYLVLSPQFILGSFGHPEAPINFLIGAQSRYVWFKLDSEYKRVLTEGGVLPIQGTASGMGWAGTFGVEWVFLKYGMMRVGFALGRENPSFENSPDLDANDFAFDFGLGLHL